MDGIEVLLVDDHPVIRFGVSKLLEQAPGISVVGEAATGAEALRLVEKVEPHVLVLDFELPDMTGAQVARRVTEGYPFVHILALSAHSGQDQVQEMLKCGALGYLTKDNLPRCIVEAVRSVAAGETWFSPRVARKLGLINEPGLYLEDDLSLDEKMVLRWMITGHSDEQISSIMEHDLVKIRKLVASVEMKLGARSRADAISRAVSDGFI